MEHKWKKMTFCHSHSSSVKRSPAFCFTLLSFHWSAFCPILATILAASSLLTQVQGAQRGPERPLHIPAYLFHLLVPLLLTSCELHSWPPCSAPAAHPGTWHTEGWFNKSMTLMNCFRVKVLQVSSCWSRTHRTFADDFIFIMIFYISGLS